MASSVPVMTTKVGSAQAPKNPDRDLKDHRNRLAYSAGPAAGGIRSSEGIDTAIRQGTARRATKSLYELPRNDLLIQLQNVGQFAELTRDSVVRQGVRLRHALVRLSPRDAVPS